MLPLSGFRVLDLTHVLAGPCATHHLCCLGAEVVKIERPESGDPMRALAMQPELEGLPPGFRALNAGKKSGVARPCFGWREAPTSSSRISGPAWQSGLGSVRRMCAR